MKSGTVVIIYDTDYFRYVPDSLKWIHSAETSKFEFNVNRVDTDLTALGVEETNGKTGAQVSFMLKDKKITLSEGEYADIYSIKLKAVQPTTITESTFGTYSTRPSQCRVVGGESQPPAQTTSYIVTPTGAATATVGDPFDITVTLTANPTTAEYGLAQAELVYDPDFVTPYIDELTNVNEAGGGKLKITHGSGENTPVGSGAVLATIPFKPTAAAAGKTAVFTVSDGAFITLEDTGGAQIKAVSGGPLSVTIATALAVIDFDATHSVLPTGYKLLRYYISGTPTVYTYNGEPMHYVFDGNDSYMTYIVASDVTAAAAEALIKDTGEAYEASADVNGIDGVNISDAQIAYDLANPSGYYSTYENLSIAARLGADVDNDGQVTQADAEAVIKAIHNS